ncbi:MAG: amidohydrolase family protein, partial [Oscillospiraceae bacterium]|nr:amidohydrolase family protein [Oscillospiraceae bacterium]
MLIKNVRIIDWQNDFFGEVLAKDGKIFEFGKSLNAEGERQTLDGGGKALMPAFVDLHAHFRDPGYTQKEDIESGSRAAARGGYTFVNLMANTLPVCSDMSIINYVRRKAGEIGLIEVHQTASITKNFDGRTLEHIDWLDGEVKWLSDDGAGVADSKVMLAAMKKAGERGMGLMCHEEEAGLAAFDSYLAEELMTFRDVKMAARAGARLHVCHVSCIGAINAIIAAKKTGAVNITCEAEPHHLLLNDETVYRVNPPLRAEK